MKHNYHSVSAIFAQSECLVAPVFQRPYVWNENDQWKPLWDDIRRVADDVATYSQLGAGVTIKIRPHFLGSVVLDQLSSAVGHLGRREIVDGQQRLTTLQVFLRAARDAAGAAGATVYAGQFEDMIWNRHVPESDPMGRYKVWPTEADREAYSAVMDHGDVDCPEAISQHAYVQAYRFFSAELRTWFGQGANFNLLKPEALSKTLKEHVRLIALDIDPGEDAQMIFETLNARGTPLLPLDLVKNWLLREARLRDANPARLYEVYWRNRFDKEIEHWREEVGRGHAQRPRADLLLHNFLAINLRDEAPAGHLFSRFLIYIDKSPDRMIEDRVREISDSADLYRRIEEPEDNAVGRRIRRFQSLDVSTINPFLMATWPRLDDASMLEVLSLVESWLVRRAVCRLSTRGYGRFFVDLAGIAIDSSDTASVLEGVEAALSKTDTDTGRWPSDDEFEREWELTPAYSSLNRGVTRFILSALEEYLRTSDGFGEPFAMPPKLEIEHILPQDWHEHWPLRQSETDLAAARENRNRLLHTFGNLTLVTGKLNKSLSNAPWLNAVGSTPCKKDTLLKKSLTKLREDVLSSELWDEDRIMRRTKVLFEYARVIWPSPPKRASDASLLAGRGQAQPPQSTSSFRITGSAVVGSQRVIQYENGSIAIEVNDVRVAVVKPVLREIATRIQVSLQNGNGNELNTRQLGAAIIARVESDNRSS